MSFISQVFEDVFLRGFKVKIEIGARGGDSNLHFTDDSLLFFSRKTEKLCVREMDSSQFFFRQYLALGLTQRKASSYCE